MRAVMGVMLAVCGSAAMLLPAGDGPTMAEAAVYRQPDTLDGPRPDPRLGPETVVRIVLDALKANGESGDSGIAVVFEFASPTNRAITGPLDRFVELVKSPVYRPLLGHRSARQGPVLVMGDEAQQLVTIITKEGEEVEFLFALSLQHQGRYRDCWLTDGVLPHRSEGGLPADPPEVLSLIRRV